MKQGNAFLLKLSDGATPPNYHTLAGLRTVSETMTAQGVSIRASSVFFGSKAENTLRRHALDGTPLDLQLSYEDGQRLNGSFVIQRLEYAGDFNGERHYTLDFESIAPVVPA